MAPFKPEYAGKINFYLSAVDDLLRHADDKPSIGLILCKAKNGIVAEYALRDVGKPLGISEFRHLETLPRSSKVRSPPSKRSRPSWRERMSLGGQALVSLLTEREWNVGYRNEDGDLIQLFYNPALACAVQYRSPHWLLLRRFARPASRGIEALIANDGRMRLIVGLTLNPPEQEALSEGYELRDQIAAKLCQVDLTPPDARAQNGLEMLAWMIAQGHLDVKVAIPIGSTGIYHEKVGIITDSAGNRIAFSGSVNETAGGWLNNRESFKVHRSWREPDFVDYDVAAFDLFWDPAQKPKSIKVYEFPEAARQKLLQFLPKDDRVSSRLIKSHPVSHENRLLPDEYRRIVWSFIRHAAQLSNGLRVGEFTSAVSPWQHQVRTYSRFISEWPCRLLIADEVGLGKTISAGLILRQAMLAGLANVP